MSRVPNQAAMEVPYLPKGEARLHAFRPCELAQRALGVPSGPRWANVCTVHIRGSGCEEFWVITTQVKA